MAAIDRLYLQTYKELNEFRDWCIVNFPRIFKYWYMSTLTLSEREFKLYKNRRAKKLKEDYLSYWNRISPDGSINTAIAHFISEEDADEDDARRLAIYYKDCAENSLKNIKDNISIPVMNTPCRIDTVLKWICPLPCIRNYLSRQCGMKEHNYYKWFFRY